MSSQWQGLGLSGGGSAEPTEVQFLLFSNEDIKRLSVVKITTPQSFDSMGNPIKGGLYDSALGPTRDRNDLCATCKQGMLGCPGHFGYIDLPLVVVNPLFFKTIFQTFRMSCLKCHRMQLNERARFIISLQLKLLDAGHVTEALDLDNFFGEVSEVKQTEEGPVEKLNKVIKKYKKLLTKRDPVAENFHSKNTMVLRARFLNNLYKTVNTAKNCKFCGERLLKITTSDNKLMYNAAQDGGKGIKIMMPDEIRTHCNAIAENDEEIMCLFIPVLKFVKEKPVSRVFFLDLVPVPPPNLRPCNVLQGELVEHHQTILYKTILQNAFAAAACLTVFAAEDQEKKTGDLDSVARQAYEGVNGTSPALKLHTIWQELQKSINQILDGDEKAQGLKQIIEKKAGVIRMHMMGKRVNFAARSVITPDPNVDIDEIGIPDVFAKKLTYPVPVTEWNVFELRKMVINGPNKHPGAEKIVNEDGRVIRIPPDSIEKRRSLANRLLTPDEYKTSGMKVVHRHLVNGDILILNRQPTLHKPSMMAHRARILQGEKTLRLHYANCKSYNADFDGDEMNAHFPQNEIARSEAYNIMSVTKQYLVPKDGTPLSGLIQDHVISGVKMSLRGTFFSKSDYQQLVFQALSRCSGEIILLPPTILKPARLWSGKQVLSTIIMNIIPRSKTYLSLSGKAKISSKAWQKEPPRTWMAGGTPFSDSNSMTEAEVIIRKGELLCGVLDKTHYGATAYGLVHCMYELYGGNCSSALLSAFSKVFTFFLQWEGFTLGVKDILVVDEANKKRDEHISIVRSMGKTAAAQATEMPVDVSEEKIKVAIEEMMTKDPKFRANLDRQYKSILDKHTNNINTACLSEGLLESFPYNNLQLMVQSGAKGSTVNTMQISCLLGQIELEGKRPPLMISGRSLPSFLPFEMTPRAGGFIDGRFMTGIQPQEFFFHCMAGREGLIDTAVKTSRSGYLQRCLIKHLEGLSVGYDMTVRDSDGSIVQFAYGEDGLDVLKCQFLRENQFSFLDSNCEAVTSKSVIEKFKENTDLKEIAKEKKSLNKWTKKHGSPMKKTRTSPFVEFAKVNKSNIDLEDLPTDKGRDPFYWSLESIWRSVDPETQKAYGRKPCPDPISCKASPQIKFGVINERLENLMQNYLKTRSQNYCNATDSKTFVDAMCAKSILSLADPGEPVGLLAAQSIGEPSTQMTLNTFHFAGRGDMNVTLGIPRLREILMTASAHLKTPNMDIPFLSDLSELNKKAERLRQMLNRVTVADVLEKIEVKCELRTSPERQLETTMRFCFLPRSQYKTQYFVKPKQIIKHMQRKFFTQMFATIKKLAKTSCGVAWSQEEGGKRKRGAKDENEEESEEVEGMTEKTRGAREELVKDDDSSDDEMPNEDDDNTAVKNRKKHAEEQEYEDPESEEEEKSDDEVERNDLEDTQTDATGQITSEVVDTYKDATNYTFDTKEFRWCEITVLFPVSFLRIDMSQALRDTAQKSVIHEVKNIRRAITYKNNKGLLLLKTEGINIPQMFNFYDMLDLNKLYSNDIHAIANTYGIEAASKVIVNEIQSVFNVYGIEVDPRHLSLVSDYMTYNGVFEPMSRKGMESSTSPLQQMSFESSLAFLKQAVFNGKKDYIRSASSCLMLGQPCRSGTGAMTLFNAGIST